MTRPRIVLIAMLIALGLSAVAAQNANQLDKLFASAQHKEIVEGDLKGAIEIYKQVVAGSRANRPLAAQALLRTAEAYQKLGNAEGKRVYEQIIREYADQPTAYASARAALTVLSGIGSQGISIRTLPSEGVDLDMSSISADGRWISAAAQPRGELKLRDMQSGSVRILAGQPFDPKNDAGAKIFDPVLSPDGKRVAYALHTIVKETDSEMFDLRVLAIDDTGTPASLLRGGRSSGIDEIWPWAWSPDGQSILAEVSRRDGTYELVWVSAIDRSVTALKSLGWRRLFDHSISRVSLSPDGHYIAFAALATNPASAREGRQDSSEKRVYVLASDGSGEAEITSVPGRAEMPVWTADGSHLLIISGDTLWAVPIAAGKPAGAPMAVQQGFANRVPLGMTSSGSYYYRDISSRVRWLSVRNVDPTGAVRPSASGQVNFGVGGLRPVWSPTGASISYERLATATEPAELVVRSVEGGTEKTFRGLKPIAWFQDGQHLLVKVDGRVGTISIVPGLAFARLDVETGAQTTLQIPPTFIHGILARDDRTFYTSQGKKVVAVDLATGQPRDVYQAAVPVGPLLGLALSPDGRSLAVRSDKAVVHVGVDGKDARVLGTLPSTVREMAWSRDGQAVLATTFTYPLDSPVFRIDVASGAVEPTGRSVPNGTLWPSSVSPDGSLVVMPEVSNGPSGLYALDLSSLMKK